MMAGLWANIINTTFHQFYLMLSLIVFEKAVVSWSVVRLDSLIWFNNKPYSL